MTISKKDMEEIKNALKSSAKQCQREWLESLNKPIIPLSLDTPSESIIEISKEEANQILDITKAWYNITSGTEDNWQSYLEHLPEMKVFRRIANFAGYSYKKQK